ncbi:hypothetical protein EVAR_62953_1 [Eumeta japonica]|uniref:Uncharacterized protein n=1 Tax=Eumeta variegata TaxID=151549 RepID=A0A4C1ZD58_EUMVA|nr:hypothetical protein EVAR_62953_1 [Eumeta japonica]
MVVVVEKGGLVLAILCHDLYLNPLVRSASQTQHRRHPTTFRCGPTTRAVSPSSKSSPVLENSTKRHFPFTNDIFLRELHRAVYSIGLSDSGS